MLRVVGNIEGNTEQTILYCIAVYHEKGKNEARDVEWERAEGKERKREFEIHNGWICSKMKWHMAWVLKSYTNCQFHITCTYAGELVIHAAWLHFESSASWIRFIAREFSLKILLPLEVSTYIYSYTWNLRKLVKWIVELFDNFYPTWLVLQMYHQFLVYTEFENFLNVSIECFHEDLHRLKTIDDRDGRTDMPPNANSLYQEGVHFAKKRISLWFIRF